jgi:hypothetical protein
MKTSRFLFSFKTREKLKRSINKKIEATRFHFSKSYDRMIIPIGSNLTCKSTNGGETIKHSAAKKQSIFQKEKAMFDKLSIEDILSVDLGYVSPSYDADEKEKSEEKESFLEELELQVITF